MRTARTRSLPFAEAARCRATGSRDGRRYAPFGLLRHARIFTVILVMWRVLKEFLLFARQEKKWWLVPLVVLLVLLGAILIFASSSGIAWALYPFF